MNTKPKLMQISKRLQLQRLAKLDLIVAQKANGCFTLPANKKSPTYDLKELDSYSRKTGIKTSELSEHDLQRFIKKRNPI
jgi:hypothetical protein